MSKNNVIYPNCGGIALIELLCCKLGGSIDNCERPLVEIGILAKRRKRSGRNIINIVEKNSIRNPTDNHTVTDGGGAIGQINVRNKAVEYVIFGIGVAYHNRYVSRLTDKAAEAGLFSVAIRGSGELCARNVTVSNVGSNTTCALASDYSADS